MPVAQLDKLVFQEEVKWKIGRDGDYEFVAMAYWGGRRGGECIPVSIYKNVYTGELGSLIPPDNFNLDYDLNCGTCYPEYREWFHRVFKDIIDGNEYTQNLLLDVD